MPVACDTVTNLAEEGQVLDVDVNHRWAVPVRSAEQETLDQGLQPAQPKAVHALATVGKEAPAAERCRRWSR